MPRMQWQCMAHYIGVHRERRADQQAMQCMAHYTGVGRGGQTNSQGIQPLSLCSQPTEALQVPHYQGQRILHTAECKANL